MLVLLYGAALVATRAPAQAQAPPAPIVIRAARLLDVQAGRDITATERVSWVMLGGKVVKEKP